MFVALHNSAGFIVFIFHFSKLVLFFSFCIARNSDKYDRFISS